MIIIKICCQDDHFCWRYVWLWSSIGLNLKIPKLEPSEHLKTKPRTSNHQFAPENRSEHLELPYYRMTKNGWVFKGFSHQNKLNLEPTKQLVWPQKPNLGPQKTKQTSEPNEVRPDTTTQRNIPKMFASFCTIPCKCRDTLSLKKIFSKINELVTLHIWGCSGLILAEFILNIAQYTKMLDSIRLGPFFDGSFCFH